MSERRSTIFSNTLEAQACFDDWMKVDHWIQDQGSNDNENNFDMEGTTMTGGAGRSD